MGWGWGVAWQVGVVVGGVENGKVGWGGMLCCRARSESGWVLWVSPPQLMT